jgi:hypothetical protein
MIMNSFDYESKLLDLLSSSTYKNIAKTPINTITNMVTKAIKYSSLDPTIQKCLIPHNPETHMIYGKSKIHKKNIPRRPIVRTIGDPIHDLARFLVDKLQAFIGKASSFIKYIMNFINKTWNLHLGDEDLMFNLDVVSMFTKILVLKSLTLICNLVDPKTLNLINIFLSSTFFTFKGVFYE